MLAVRLPMKNLWGSPRVILALFVVWHSGIALCQAQDQSAAGTGTNRSLATLVEQIGPFYEVLAGRNTAYDLQAKVDVPIDGRQQNVTVQMVRYDDQAFDLHAQHPEYAVSIIRRNHMLAMVLPKHRTVYVGEGELDARSAESDSLAPLDAGSRLVSGGSLLSDYLPILFAGDTASTVRLATTLVKISLDETTGNWRIGNDLQLTSIAPPAGQSQTQHLKVTAGDVSVALSLGPAPQTMVDSSWPDFQVVHLQRNEMERQFARGLRRALEVLLPSARLTNPSEHPQKIPHGELRYVDGQRLVLLSGSPIEIGEAHGKLLREEADRCIDSVLNAFGTVQTVVTGRWFRHDLAAAYQRLRPHIPEDHVSETRALALAIHQDPDVLEVLNVFPELFHCSGFALFGSATADGSLYHGRVLDYMTTIGLQDCATTFIVSVDGKIPFANVGYAGFTGSVSGMNAQSISLGEMGGRGEGQWDGVPMATLMRRALEECNTLDDVIKLWSTSPRTCEYYYVFADGKTNAAVGVAATPESIEFVQPGQGHPLLGEGITDAVVLSAGSRLETLRARVKDHHGKIDAEKAMWLMSRPVAMESNLHNVLFVPSQGILYVANADHNHPAAERPYVRFNLMQLLESFVDADH